MKHKVVAIIAVTIIATKIGMSSSLDTVEAVKLLRKFEFQQLNYAYQKFFRLNGLYKSSPYVQEADIATTGFALAGLVAAAENGLISLEKAKEMALETISACLDLQKNPSQSYEGFLYHYYIYNEYTESLEHKPGVEVSTIDTALLLAGILTAGEYFDSKGFPEVREAAIEFYSNINWRTFFDEDRKQFHMAWRGRFEGHWDFYTDEILLIALLAQGSPNPDYRVDIRDVLANIQVRKDNYNGYEYVYSWYGSLFTYLFAHIFVDFRRLGEDIIYGIDWWQNTKYAILADIEWCKEQGYPEGIWGLSAAWSRISPNSNTMEYRWRIGAALCGAWDRIDNEKNGVRPIAPHAGIACLPFFEELPITENPAFKLFLKVHEKAVDRSGLLVESLDASRLDEKGLPEVNSHWLVGMDIIYPALMIENYFTGLIWDNFMRNFYIKFAILKVFPSYYLHLAKR